jgi:hypothetical protein
VPLFGPLIDLHRCRDCTGSPIEAGIIGGLVLDFALQATGLALLTAGLVKHYPKHHVAVLTAPASLTVRF